MKKNRSLGPGLSSAETTAGIVFLLVQLLVLPTVLSWLNRQLGSPLGAAEVNFLYYFVNFIAVTVIFHDFWGAAMGHAIHHPVDIFQAVILGLAAYYAGMLCVETVIGYLAPAHANYNNDAMFALQRSSPFLTALGTVVLTPPVEEVLHRGVIFRNLYGKSRWGAYAVSTGVFAFVHMAGYLGQYSPLTLGLTVLQYAPAGLALAWSYAKSDSIFAPILIHAIINSITLGLIF